MMMLLSVEMPMADNNNDNILNNDKMIVAPIVHFLDQSVLFQFRNHHHRLPEEADPNTMAVPHRFLPNQNE